MTNSETQDVPAQLPLPAGFLEPGPRPLVGDPAGLARAETFEATDDTAIEDLIRHFRRTACRRALATGPKSLLDRLLLLRRSLAAGDEAAPAVSDGSETWPRLSIIMPLFDLNTPFRESLGSILEQSYPDLELILVSSGDRALLEETIKPLREQIILVTMPMGARFATALRRGFARASGDVLGWVEPGTIILPGSLNRVGEHFATVDAAAVLAMDAIREVYGWRFAGVAGVDPAFLFFSRLAYDMVGGDDPSLDDDVNSDSIGTSLGARIAAKHGLRHIPVHAAVVRRRASPNDDAEVADYAAPLQTNAPKGLWFAPDASDQVPPEAVAISIAPAPCPITGAAPERLLFASPDVRFGTPGLHDIWYHPDSHCTATAPALGRSEIRRLAAQQPPLTERRIIEPEADAPSPWRQWRFGARLLALALDHPLPGWLLDRWPLKLAIGWTDRTGLEIENIVSGLLPRGGKESRDPVHALEVGCHTGEVLDHLQRLGWKTHGTEINVAAAEAARAKGHTIWTGAPDDILQTVPVEERFDMIFLGHVVERQADPLALVQRAARLLNPTGLLVIATPNLDSAQIKLFGPTWAHWHPPYHRNIFSRRTIALMAEASGLRLRRCRTWSHPYWSWLSLRLNRGGLAAVVPNGIVPDSETRSAVETVIVTAKLMADWRGRGDYLYAALSPDLRG